jgi:uncharacterized protein
MEMQRFYKTHFELIESVKAPIQRELKDEIDWNHRLIGIKGPRGIGKTTFLLDYIKSTFGNSKTCLYVNLNNFFFSGRSLVEFANNFRKTGGKTLVLDQVYKYPQWSQALSEINYKFPDLQVIFTGSPVMRLKEDNPYLGGKVASYHLRGLSFREFINHETGNNFSKYSLEDILKYHIQISKDILIKVKSLAYFDDYLQYGVYPFYVDSQNFNEEMIKTVNLTLEIDIPYLQQMEPAYLPKLRKLIYLLCQEMPHYPNVSQLSASIETSRATVMNYLKYLKNARLINLIYDGLADDTKKPDQIYFQNTNLLHSVSMIIPTNEALTQTFLINQLQKDHKVEGNGKDGDFVIDEEYTFKTTKPRATVSSDKVFYTLSGDEVGQGNKIPLWLLGFLY